MEKINPIENPIQITCEGKENIPFKLLKPFQGDLKFLAPENKEKLINSIIKEGFMAPIFIWKPSKTYNIIDGTQRYLALSDLKSRGWEIPDIPVIYITAKNKNEAKRKLLKITSSFGEFDKDTLQEWINECEESIIDDIRLADEKMELFFSEIGAEDDIETLGDDEVNEDVEKITKLGDLWELGNHRLLCGDSTKKEDVEKLMNGEKVDIVFTSPPYNVDKTPNGKNGKAQKKYLNDKDNKDKDSYVNLLTDFTSMSLLHSDYIFVNIQSLAGNKIALIEYMYNLKTKFADTIIWDKGSAEPAMVRKVMNSQFEYIHVFSNEAKRTIGKKDFRGTISNHFTLNFRKGKEFAKVHKATFRVELPMMFIDYFVESSCYDPFSGTGTTIIASEKKNIKGFGMELEPLYCDIAVNRYIDWCEKNDKKPIVKHNGKIFKKE